jgi:hypothetical protein
MSAWRSFVPVSWESVVSCDAVSRRIFFRHIGGLATGMEVVWSIEPMVNETLVVITHEMDLIRVPVVRSLPGKMVTGRFFVHHIADQTLRTMKTWIEQQSVGQ